MQKEKPNPGLHTEVAVLCFPELLKITDFSYCNANAECNRMCCIMETHCMETVA